MKKTKLLAIGLTSAIALNTLFSVPVLAENRTLKMGDINLDGNVTATDLAILKLALVGLRDLTGESFANADLNGDGRISATDLSRFQKLIIGLNLQEEDLYGRYVINPRVPKDLPYKPDLYSKGVEIIKYTSKEDNEMLKYVFIKRGLCANSGYKIKVDNIEISEGKATINVSQSGPEEGKFYIDSITTPYVVVKLNNDLDVEVKGLFEDSESNISHGAIKMRWSVEAKNSGTNGDIIIENMRICYNETEWNKENGREQFRTQIMETVITENELENMQFVSSIDLEKCKYRDKETPSDEFNTRFFDTVINIAKNTGIFANYVQDGYDERMDANHDGKVTYREKGDYDLENLVREFKAGSILINGETWVSHDMKMFQYEEMRDDIYYEYGTKIHDMTLTLTIVKSERYVEDSKQIDLSNIKITRSELEKIEKTIDLINNGYSSYKKSFVNILIDIVKNRKVKCNKDSTEYIKEIDTNGDGIITYREYGDYELNMFVKGI